VLGLNAWVVGNVLQNVASWIEREKNLQEMIQSTHSTYAKQLKMTWDVKNWDSESTKVS